MSKQRREFSPKTRRLADERSGGICERHRINRFGCDVRFDDNNVSEYHHIVDARHGGDNGLDNCARLCRRCHAIETKRQSRMRAQEVRFAKERRGDRKRKRVGPPLRSRGFWKDGPKRKIPSRPLGRKKLESKRT